MPESGTIVSESEDDTLDIGKRIGEGCNGGEILGLIGPLGSGKSVLVRGIARGLGIESTVRSPSFNLMREYSGRLNLKHWDLYRLDSGYRELGLLESSTDDSVVVIEWSERWEELENFCTGRIFIDHGTSDNSRTIRFDGEIPGNEIH